MSTKKVVTKKTVETKAVPKNRELTKEEKTAQLMKKMNEAALEAQVAFSELDKKVRVSITEFFKAWYPKAGYKKLGKMIVGKPFITEPK